MSRKRLSPLVFKAIVDFGRLSPVLFFATYDADLRWMNPLRNPSLQAKDRIIFPLDFDSIETARPYISLLKNHVGLFKVGLTLFIQEGLQVLEQIETLSGGRKIFLDLKLYDTPMQLGRAAAVLLSEASRLRFLTVHASGGLRVVKSVVDILKGKVEVLGVTALTSLSQAESSAQNSPPLEERVAALAAIAREAGAGGVVASGHEAALLKRRFGDNLTIVTPGIRPAWSQVKGDDQRRKMTPGEAISNGADYLVVGRPIYSDKDPVGAAIRIAEEIEASFRQSPK